MKLSDILERQCSLIYYMKMTLYDIEECDLTELKWIYGWLVNTKNEENESHKRLMDVW